MPAETILIIEDDASMLRVLHDNFQFSGYVVKTACDGEQGLHAARGAQPDLIDLDIMLPKINGYEVCRSLRKDGLDMPIIMLTAKGQEPDIVLGLNLGADDYVTKPFSIVELMARTEALLRRRQANEATVQRFGQFQLDIVSRKLIHDNIEVPLSPKEFDLLAFFVRRSGRALTRDDILRCVWSDDPLVTSRSVDRFVNPLRSKIETDPHRPVFIKTVRNIGYRFETAET